MTNNNKPIVWAVQEGKNDYAAAEDFGEVRFITTSDYRSIDCQQNDKVKHDIRRFLSCYNQGTDLIIPTGNPMTIAIVNMSLRKGKHKFLKWDGRRATYIPHILEPIAL